MAGVENGDFFNTSDCLIEVTECVGLTVLMNINYDHFFNSSLF